MAEIKIGRVRIAMRGAWSNVTTYVAMDGVSYNGSSYVAIQDVPTGTVPTNTTYWMLMAQKGDTGAQGVGAQWYSGASDPASGAGAVNDFHLNSTSGDVFKKTGATTWTLQGNIKGPQGPQGAQGAQGPQGNVGPQGPQGVKGDTGATGATGPAGATGPQGVKGDTGAQGPQGNTGPQGPQGVKGDPGDTTPAYLALAQQVSDNAAAATTAAATATTEANRAASYTPTGVAKAISGLTPYNHSTTPLTRIGVTAGTARDKDNNVDIVLPVAMSKMLNAVWSAGEGGGALDVALASIPASSVLHLFVIRNPTSFVVDLLASTSPTAPTMPSGYTQRRRIGMVDLDGSKQIVPGIWYANGDFEYATPIQVATSLGLGSAALLTVLKSSGVKRKARINFLASAAVGTGFWLVARDADLGAPTTSTQGRILFKASEAALATITDTLWCDTAGRIYVWSQSPSSSNLVTAYTHGWTDFRDEYA